MEVKIQVERDIGRENGTQIIAAGIYIERCRIGAIWSERHCINKHIPNEDRCYEIILFGHYKQISIKGYDNAVKLAIKTLNNMKFTAE